MTEHPHKENGIGTHKFSKILLSFMPDLAKWEEVPDSIDPQWIVRLAHVTATYAVTHNLSAQKKKELRRLFREEYDKRLFSMIDALQHLGLVQDRVSHWQNQIDALWHQTWEFFCKSLDVNTVDHDKCHELFAEGIQIERGMKVEAGYPVELEANERALVIRTKPKPTRAPIGQKQSGQVPLDVPRDVKTLATVAQTLGFSHSWWQTQIENDKLWTYRPGGKAGKGPHLVSMAEATELVRPHRPE